jgi:hypothetical protein
MKWFRYIIRCEAGYVTDITDKGRPVTARHSGASHPFYSASTETHEQADIEQGGPSSTANSGGFL